jgi:hypothetical protein
VDRPWVRCAILTLRARGWPRALDADRYSPALQKQVRAFQVQQGAP